MGRWDGGWGWDHSCLLILLNLRYIIFRLKKLPLYTDTNFFSYKYQLKLTCKCRDFKCENILNQRKIFQKFNSNNFRNKHLSISLQGINNILY